MNDKQYLRTIINIAKNTSKKWPERATLRFHLHLKYILKPKTTSRIFLTNLQLQSKSLKPVRMEVKWNVVSWHKRKSSKWLHKFPCIAYFPNFGNTFCDRLNGRPLPKDMSILEPVNLTLFGTKVSEGVTKWRTSNEITLDFLWALNSTVKCPLERKAEGIWDRDIGKRALWRQSHRLKCHCHKPRNA